MSQHNPLDDLTWLDAHELRDLLDDNLIDDDESWTLRLINDQWWLLVPDFDACVLIPACDGTDSFDEVREYAYELLQLDEFDVTIGQETAV